MGNAKPSRPPITGLDDALDTWDRYDGDATSAQIAALLNAAGLEVAERTVRSRRRARAREPEQRSRNAKPRKRNPLTLNTGLAAQVLEQHGVSDEDTTLMLAVASIDAFTDVQWRVFEAASKEAESMKQGLKDLENKWDETGISHWLVERLTLAAKQVRTRDARAAPVSSEQRSIHLTDQSPACTHACEGNASPHRHCVVCDRTWIEQALQFRPVYDRRAAMYRYTVRRDEQIVWTGNPDRDDAFIWACATCKRAAVAGLPPSSDRDELLRALPLDDRHAKAPAEDNTFERAFRRVPGLWPWTDAIYRADEDATVLAPMMPLLTARLPTGGEISFGVAARIVFAPYADLGAMFCMLDKVQKIVAMDLPTIAAAAQEARQSVAKLPAVWCGSLPGFPSLGVFTVTIVIGLHDVRPPR
jgi:hypothetical protein